MKPFFASLLTQLRIRGPFPGLFSLTCQPCWSTMIIPERQTTEMAKIKSPDDQPVHKFWATVSAWLKQPLVIGGLVLIALSVYMFVHSPEHRPQTSEEQVVARKYAFTN